MLKVAWRLLVWSFALAGSVLWLIARPFGRRAEAWPEVVPADAFYRSHRWRSLRIDALEGNRERYGVLTCECCLARTAEQWHVDHIQPRSLHPELALEICNLQVLCEACNLGKGDRYTTDWRFPSEG